MPKGQGRPADDHARRCGAQSQRSGKQCRAWAVRGTDPPRCANHAGKSRGELDVQRAQHDARQRAMRQARRMVARAGIDQDPTEHLLDSLHTAAQQAEVFGAMVADLDDAGEVFAAVLPGLLRGTASDPLLARNSAGTLTVHPFVDLWTDAVERRAKFAKLAIDADVAGRLVRLQEDTAAMLDTALGRALMAAGVDHATQLAIRRHYGDALAGEVIELGTGDLDD